MSVFELNGISIAVKRSARRKTMALKVNGETVSLHLPKRLPLWLGKQFVSKQYDWLQSRLKLAHQQPKREFTNGSLQPYLGESYPLWLDPDLKQRRQLDFNHQRFNIKLPVTASTEQINQTLRRGYRQLADSFLIARCQQLAEQHQFSPKSIQLRRYTARWGSCNTRGNIQLNWLLIQAPLPVIDYVIVHELCHLQHMNHSADFWHLVEQLNPDYRQHRDWLKQNGQQLML